MFGDIVTRVLIELGPWLWMLAGFALMTVEIFSNRGIALSLALGAMITGTIAVFGASGIWPSTSNLIQCVVFLCGSLAIYLALTIRAKSA